MGRKQKYLNIATKIALCGAIAVLAVLSFSCVKKSKPTVKVPDKFTVKGEVIAPEKWWKSFDDPNLDYLIDRAQADNLDLLMAWDRIDQMTSLKKQADSGLFPNVNASLGSQETKAMSYNRSENTYNSAGGGAGAGMGSSFGTSHSLSVSASYELDLWGRVRNSRKASKSDLRASREDLDAMAITITSEVGRLWYDLVEKDLQIKMLEGQKKINETYLELLELRFNQGMSAASEVLQQRQQLEQTMGEFPMVRMSRQLTEYQLAAMLGEPPGADLGVKSGSLPDLPPFPETGVPSDLLLRRPDVRAARYRLEAADYRVAEAIANRFPTVSLTATASDTEPRFEDLFDDWVLNLAANLTAPIFDAGRRKQEVVRKRAAASESLHNFEKTVLTALGEVESAIVQERSQSEFVASVDEQVKTARMTLKFAMERYGNGATDYLPVLVSIQTLQRLERSQIESKRVLITYRINLYRALGGGWVIERKSADEKTVADDKERVDE